jgi:N utilization substance protein B
MSGRRRKSRELALQLLYQNDLAGTEPEEMFLRTDEYSGARPDVQEYASRLLLGTLACKDELDAKLSERSEHWRLGRMPAVDRNLLRLALYELLYETDTPHAVVIDEAVEIAKKFSTPSSGPFVNGVLDGIRRAAFGPRAPGPEPERERRADQPPSKRVVAREG